MILIFLDFYVWCPSYAWTGAKSYSFIEAETAYQKLPQASNLAPLLAPNEGVCKTDILWGRPHAGGWMVCLDSDVFTQKDPLNNVPENKCIVYSFGLGADWSFDNAAESLGCEVRELDKHL